MANNTYQQFQYSLEKYPVTLYAKYHLNNSGAVEPLVFSENQGIYSIDAGLVTTVVLGNFPQNTIDKYYRILDFSAVIIDASDQPPLAVHLTNDTVSVDGSFTFNIYYMDSDGTITTPSNVDVLLKIVLKNSSV